MFLSRRLADIGGGSQLRQAFSEDGTGRCGRRFAWSNRFAKAAGGAGTKSKIRTGVATHEIVEAAKELDVDLIVIATHGYHRLEAFRDR